MAGKERRTAIAIPLFLLSALAVISVSAG